MPFLGGRDPILVECRLLSSSDPSIIMLVSTLAVTTKRDYPDSSNGIGHAIRGLCSDSVK